MTGFEWLLVDLASRYGHDKVSFEERIAWSKSLLPYIGVDSIKEFRDNMKPWITEADDPEMFSGAALAIHDAYHGRESTWQVGQDSASSGPQLLSVLLKCETGMSNTGVLGSEVPDLYQTIADNMGSDIPRNKVKKATVPHVYASEAAPKAVFGDDYEHFVNAYIETVPMAELAKNIMVNAWNPEAEYHEWDMPDGAIAHVKVLNTEKKSNYPLGKHSYTYQYQTIGTKEIGTNGTKSLSANTTHSYDGYVLRELNRRCNYDEYQLRDALDWLSLPSSSGSCEKLERLQKLYEEFKQPSLVCVEYITSESVGVLSESYKRELRKIILDVLSYPSFEVKNVHDEFLCLPNHVDQMKYWYNQLLIETYKSNWWIATANRLTGEDYSSLWTEPKQEIISQIASTQYAIN